MRVTKEKAAEHRERIVAEAARLFREKGFDGVGVDAVMAAAGLTHGGFYRHFGSKEELAAEAVAKGLAKSAALQGKTESLQHFVEGYLSPRHRDDKGGGCMIAALGADVARQGRPVRRLLTGRLRTTIDRIAGWMEGNKATRRERAITAYAGMIGAMVLARAVDDRALSDEILATARSAFGKGGAKPTP
jgi:TetR/AcrR family transcriptional repressor of nem operon